VGESNKNLVFWNGYILCLYEIVNRNQKSNQKIKLIYNQIIVNPKTHEISRTLNVEGTTGALITPLTP
jgi:hypothetical protein